MKANKALAPLLTLLLTAPLAADEAFAQDADTPPVEGESDTKSGGDNETTQEAEESQRELEEKEDDRKRLSDRIKSVQRKAFIKKERIEVFPQVGFDLNDPFYQHMLVGGAVGYHISDSFAIEARGGLAFRILKQNALRIARVEADSLILNPPEFKYHADLDFLWAPFYGKISLLGEAIMHFDTYVTAGPGIFGTDAGVNPAANVGIGQRYFITDWLVARIELRDYMFIDTRNGESDIQNLMVFGFALSGFFPTSFSYELQ